MIPTIPQTEKMKMFEQYRGIARHLASKFAKWFGKAHKELLEEAEGVLALKICTWESRYRPDKSSPTTWVYQGIYHELLNYCTRRRTPPTPFSIIYKDDQFLEIPAKRDFLLSLLKDMSNEAQFLVQTIINCPAEIAEDVSVATRSRGRQAVKRYLKEKEQWDTPKIKRVWAEVSACL